MTKLTTIVLNKNEIEEALAKYFNTDIQDVDIEVSVVDRYYGGTSVTAEIITEREESI